MKCSLCGITDVVLARLSTSDERVCLDGIECGKRRRDQERDADLGVKVCPVEVTRAGTLRVRP